MTRALVLFAIFCLAMVGAMVQFNYTIVADDPKKAENRTLWGVVYIALWVGIELSLWDLVRHDHPLTRPDMAAFVLAPVGWLTFNAMWAALLGALDVRDAEQRRVPPSRRALGLRRIGGRLTIIGLAIVVALLFPLGAPQALVSSVRALPLALAVVGAMTIIGWTLLVGGGVSLALGTGDTTTQDYGRLGTRKVASGEVTISFHELKEAWRQRLWIHDARWRTIFLMFLGAILAAYGLFGIFIVQGPIPVRLLCAGALAYATIRTAAGLWRA